MAKVSISEAARLTGKSRTTLHRLIKAGDLSTCRLASKDSHIDSLKQAMLLLENREEKRQNTTRPRAWWRFWQS